MSLSSSYLAIHGDNWERPILQVRYDDQHWVILARHSDDAALVKLPFTYSNAGLGWLMKQYHLWGVPRREGLVVWSKTASKK